MGTLRNLLFQIVEPLPRRHKQVVFLCVDVALVPVALYLSSALAYNSLFPLIALTTSGWLYLILPVVAALLTSALGIPKIKLKSYESLAILKTAALAALLSVSAFVVLAMTSGSVVPVAVILFGLIFFLTSVGIRLEHLFIIGERPAGIAGKYTPAYYSRTAGAEETTPASEVLAAVLIGSSRRPAVVVNIENDDGRQLGLIEHTAPGQWRSVWRSAYTDC